MSASLRVPWRAIGRSIKASPSKHLLRPQCPPKFPLYPQSQTRLHASDSTTQSTTPAADGVALTGSSPSPEAAADAKDGPALEQKLPEVEFPKANPLIQNAEDQFVQSAQNAAKETSLEKAIPAEVTKTKSKGPEVRVPRAVQAAYLTPLRREAKYGVPSCNLQLRAFNVRNLEFFCDFALRAAYYLGLPASGPVPLPRILERWTVPRANFIHKKSQENFERKTLRRLIQIKDGHPETVEIWLAFLQKHAYYGIAMKANVWEFTHLDVGKHMDADLESMKDEVDSTLNRFAFKKGSPIEENPLDHLNTAAARRAVGWGPMLKPWTGVPQGGNLYNPAEDDGLDGGEGDEEDVEDDGEGK